MARRDLNLEEEKRSYAGLWLLGAALLVVGAIWALMDDSLLRRPWKAYQRSFFALEEQKEREKLEDAHTKLEADQKFQAAKKALEEAQASLDSEETQRKIAAAQARRAQVALAEGDADLKVRFVKSELEEAWYQYDHAIESGGDVGAARKRRDQLEAEKKEREAEWKATQDQLARIDAEIAELQAPQKDAQKKVDELAADREAIATKIDGMKTVIGVLEVPRIPTIEQIVVTDFDVNNFEQPVDRVDRCTSCHVAINKAGFENDAHPLRTHPKRELFLGKHPPEKFGCTPCHDGQGVALNSIKQAHGNVPFWEHPLLEGPQMQSRCLNCHRDVSGLEGAETIAQGQQLFEQLGCPGCHLVEDYEEIPPVGPSLKRAAAKLDPQWMVSWIHNPQQFRPRTKMPNFQLNDEQSRAVASYIWTSSKEAGNAWLAAHEEPTGISASDAALVAHGKELFDSVGCRACHAIAPDEVATPLGASKDWAPNLQRVGEKTSPRFLYWWIKNPHGYNPGTRMPSLRLSDEEARAIVSYLLSLSQKPEPAEGAVTAAVLEQPALAEQGKALVRKYGCFACHEINGMEGESRIGVELSTFGAKGLEELYFGNRAEIPRTWNDWTYNKLKDPRIYATEHIEQLMPNFHLAEEDIIALRVWLQSREGHKPPLRYRDPGFNDRGRIMQAGRRMIEQFNCRGCHVIDDRGGYVRRLYEDNPTSAPPILNGEGAKVQPDWFYGFLQDPARQPLRFWLKIRMPTFGLDATETTKIVEYFTAAAKETHPYFFWDPKVDSTPELLQAGQKLMSDEYFSCWSCHVRGSETPGGPMEQWAPNLAYAHARLNPNWILRWIKDPPALMPGTKMPSFYPGGPEDIFDGNEDKQILAMRDYIMSLGASHGAAAPVVANETTPPPGAGAAGEAAPAAGGSAAAPAAGGSPSAAIRAGEKVAVAADLPAS